MNNPLKAGRTTENGIRRASDETARGGGRRTLGRDWHLGKSQKRVGGEKEGDPIGKRRDCKQNQQKRYRSDAEELTEPTTSTNIEKNSKQQRRDQQERENSEGRERTPW